MPESRIATQTIASLLAVTLMFFYTHQSKSDTNTHSVSAQRANELESLLRQDCGSCHGLKLTGGLGRPLTPEALSGKTDDYLFAAIRHGIPDTAMPAWDALLTESDIAWLVRRLSEQPGAVQ